MTKTLLILPFFLFLSLWGRAQTASVRQRPALLAAHYIARGEAELQKGDTLEAAAFLHQAVAPLSQLSNEEALVLQSKLAAVLARLGFPDANDAFPAGEVPGAADPEEAARGGTAAGHNHRVLTRFRLAYAGGLAGFGEEKAAIDIYASLLAEESLSETDRIHILSLLVTNLIKLNSTARVPGYFRQLQQAVARAGRGGETAEYRQAAALYHAFRKQRLQARAAYRQQAAPGAPTAAPALSAREARERQELVRETRELTLKYQVLESRQRAEQAAHRQQLQALGHARERQRFLLVILGLSLVVVSAGALTYIFYQRRRQAVLLHHKELEAVRQRHRAEVVQALSSAQESERGRIAGQLHDEVGTMLSVARLNLSTLNSQGAGEAAEEKLETTGKLLGTIAQTIREMSHRLMPVALQQYGLKNAVRQLVADINTSGALSVEVVLIGFDQPDRLADDLQVILYRMVQELLQNVVRHAGARKALVQLVAHEDAISLMVEDNGTGMPASKGQGKGMTLLASRVDYLEGVLSVEPGSEGGTLVVVEIPLTKNA